MIWRGSSRGGGSPWVHLESEGFNLDTGSPLTAHRPPTRFTNASTRSERCFSDLMADQQFLEGQVRAAQQRLKQAQGERGRLLDAFQGGHLEKKEFEVRMSEVRARVNGLDADLKALEDEHRRALGGMAFLERIGGFTRTVTDKLDTMDLSRTSSSRAHPS